MLVAAIGVTKLVMVHEPAYPFPGCRQLMVPHRDNRTFVVVAVPNPVAGRVPAPDDVTTDNRLAHDLAAHGDTLHHHSWVSAIDQHCCVSRRSTDPRRNFLDYQNISIGANCSEAMTVLNIFCWALIKIFSLVSIPLTRRVLLVLSLDFYWFLAIVQNWPMNCC